MKPVLFTVNGTGCGGPFDPGFSGDLGRAFAYDPWQALASAYDGISYDTAYEWQPIGYAGSVFPMGPSITGGVTELVRQINRYPDRRFALSGYSQGALVTDLVWCEHILSPTGSLHHRLDDVIAVINYGDPARCPGIANGNKMAGMPMPKTVDGYTTGGIAGPRCMKPEQTPEHFLSFALDGDLYAAAPVGDTPWTTETEVGHDETIIFDMVLETSITTLYAFAVEVAEILTQPLSQVLPLVLAIVNGLTFAAQGTNAPHWRYQIGPAVHYLTQRAAQLI